MEFRRGDFQVLEVAVGDFRKEEDDPLVERNLGVLLGWLQVLRGLVVAVGVWVWCICKRLTLLKIADEVFDVLVLLELIRTKGSDVGTHADESS